MSNRDQITTTSLILWLLVMLAGAFLVLAQPYFESQAFNKFTDGPKATYWDAVWADLRVTPK